MTAISLDSIGAAVRSQLNQEQHTLWKIKINKIIKKISFCSPIKEDGCTALEQHKGE